MINWIRRFFFGDGKPRNILGTITSIEGKRYHTPMEPEEYERQKQMLLKRSRK